MMYDKSDEEFLKDQVQEGRTMHDWSRSDVGRHFLAQLEERYVNLVQSALQEEPYRRAAQEIEAIVHLIGSKIHLGEVARQTLRRMKDRPDRSRPTHVDPNDDTDWG